MRPHCQDYGPDPYESPTKLAALASYLSDLPPISSSSVGDLDGPVQLDYSALLRGRIEREGAATGTIAEDDGGWIEVVSVLSIGRKSIAVLVRMRDGTHAILKAYKPDDSDAPEEVPMQYWRELAAYRALHSLKLDYDADGQALDGTAPITPHCYGYLRIPAPSIAGERLVWPSTVPCLVSHHLARSHSLLLIAYLPPERGWKTLRDQPTSPRAEAALEALERSPWPHGDALARNVLVRRTEDGGWQAAWVDWASCKGQEEPPQRLPEKLRELSLAWRRFSRDAVIEER